ncbi:MAG: hypothetical protein K2X48_05425 [Chitinophagaceae bacterium]|nr:hypothetical protein [Chitinophagaceae bacterium]
MIQKLIYSRCLRWALLTGLLFLVLMTLLRVVFVWFFHPTDFSFVQAWPSFVLGLRFDLRIAAIIALFIRLLSSVKPFNPFHNATAKKVWLLVMGIATFIFCIFYGTDFAHYAYLSQRLNATVLNYLADFTIS